MRTVVVGAWLFVTGGLSSVVFRMANSMSPSHILRARTATSQTKKQGHAHKSYASKRDFRAVQMENLKAGSRANA
jgi:hypothetical protein